jgi:RNA polymerase sigma factor (sigma-70 family)
MTAVAVEPLNLATGQSLQIWLRANDPEFVQRFNQLYRWLEGEIRRHPKYGLVASEHPPESLVNLVWQRTVRNPERLEQSFRSEQRGAFRAYLCEVIGSAIIDEWRNLRARKRGGDATHEVADDGALPPPTGTFVDGLIAKDLRAMYVEHLEESESELFRLRVDAGLDFAEIALRLGCTESAARSRFDRIRRSLPPQPS